MNMPDDVVYTIIVFVSTLISVSILGLVAGFSPTLYVTQIAITSKVKRPVAFAAALMSGVLVAVLTLIILFQVIQLDALIALIDTTVRAIILSVVFNMLVGIGFIYGGIWYLRHQTISKVPKIPKPTKTKRTGGLISVFSLGYIKTFISITGVTATYFAANIIANVSLNLVERVVFTLVFFAVAIVPFIGIVIYMRKSPERILKATTQFQDVLHRINYRLIVGVGAMILGSCILVFNLMMILFY